MRIGIDCRLLGPEQGGLGRYLEQLVKHLSEFDTHNQYVLFLRKHNFTTPIITSKKFHYTKVLADIPWYGWREQLFFKKIIDRAEVELMHFPHWNIPLTYNQPFVVTIHDLLLLEYPTRAASTLGPVTYWFKNVAYRIVLHHAVRRAKHIITTSNFSKADIIKKLGISADLITSIYQAPGLVPLQASELLQTKVKFAVTKPYLLYVGVAYPHKNLDRLISAWSQIQIQTNYRYQLVLVGKNNYFYQQLQKKVRDQNVSDVIFTGLVTDEDLVSLYRGASLFVYPSLYEGFGIPPLEAWQNGVPVVASDSSCLPEILGTGALYFEATSVEDLVVKVIEGLQNQSLRQELVTSAKHELTRFSWQKFVTETLIVYQNNRAQEL